MRLGLGDTLAEELGLGDPEGEIEGKICGKIFLYFTSSYLGILFSCLVTPCLRNVSNLGTVFALNSARTSLRNRIEPHVIAIALYRNLINSDIPIFLFAAHMHKFRGSKHYFLYFQLKQHSPHKNVLSQI